MNSNFKMSFMRSEVRAGAVSSTHPIPKKRFAHKCTWSDPITGERASSPATWMTPLFTDEIRVGTRGDAGRLFGYCFSFGEEKRTSNERSDARQALGKATNIKLKCGIIRWLFYDPWRLCKRSAESRQPYPPCSYQTA